MIKFRYFLFIIFCLGLFFNSKATHNRAGEITYKWLYGYTYEIKITTYTNIGGINLADRCEDTLYFGDGTHTAVLRSNGPIGICSPAHDGAPLPNGTIKLNEYITTHTYAGPGNYKMSMEDPNRNVGIINIPNSVNQVFYIESFLVIPSFGLGNNSSPVLTFPPIDNGCVTQCFYHNPGAYDIDGDSISYELTTCRGNFGSTCPGYSYPATGSGIFNVDSLTGTLKWCSPQLQGEYNIAMLIKEWRLDNSGNYFLIGYVLRDMQVDVGSCNNYPPQIMFNNLDTCIVAGTNFTNTIAANDLNGDYITISANGGPFAFTLNPSSFISTPSTSITSGTFNLNTTYSHIRRMPYQVTVKVKDNNSVISLVHFKTFNVKIIPNAPLNLTTYSSNNYILLKWNKPTNYSLVGANSFLKYKVFRKNGLSNWTPSNNETNPPAYTGFSYIGSTSNNINDTLFYDYIVGNSFTPGEDYSYVVVTQYADGSCSYVSNISSNQIFVGIKEFSLDNFQIKIFPNPIYQNFTVRFNRNSNELFTIDLVDITGRKIKTFINNESLTKENLFQFNLENINQGIYFLKITGNQNTNITKKIIKQ